MTSLPGMPPDADLARVLAVDIGSTRTKAALFEQLDGRWRLAGSSEAISTIRSPREGLLGGMATAIRALEKATERRLTDSHGKLLIGAGANRGADAMVATSSAAEPLSVIVLATTAESAGGAAKAAAEWSLTHVVDTAARDGGLSAGRARRWADELHRNGEDDVVAKARLLAPDAVLVAGGYEGGAVAPVLDIITLLSSVRPVDRPPLTVLFAGNSRAAARAARILAGRAELRIADNVLPEPDVPHPESAGEALDDLYCERKLGALNGYSVLSSLCAAPVLSSARALALAWTTLAETLGGPVIGLDIGACTTIAGVFNPDGVYRLRVHPDLGASMGWDDPAHDIETTRVARWIPIPLGKTEIQTRLLNRRGVLAVPQNDDGHMLQEAMTREAWRMLLETTDASGLQIPPVGREPVHIVGSGGVMVHIPSLWRAALVLLDTVEPHGLAQLWIDRAGVLPQVGALAALSPNAARSLIEGDVLRPLALAICLDGSTTPGSKAVDVELKMPDGSTRRTIAAWGSIHLLATGLAGNTQVTIRPVPGVYIPGYAEEPDVTFVAPGSELGVILDCRGRPLAAHLDPGRSYARMHAWIMAGEQAYGTSSSS